MAVSLTALWGSVLILERDRHAPSRRTSACSASGHPPPPSSPPAPPSAAAAATAARTPSIGQRGSSAPFTMSSGRGDTHLPPRRRDYYLVRHGRATDDDGASPRWRPRSPLEPGTPQRNPPPPCGVVSYCGVTHRTSQGRRGVPRGVRFDTTPHDHPPNRRAARRARRDDDDDARANVRRVEGRGVTA